MAPSTIGFQTVKESSSGKLKQKKTILEELGIETRAS